MNEERRRWDDLVGETYEAACQRINSEVPGLNIIKLAEVSDMKNYIYLLYLNFVAVMFVLSQHSTHFNPVYL